MTAWIGLRRNHGRLARRCSPCRPPALAAAVVGVSLSQARRRRGLWPDQKVHL